MRMLIFRKLVFLLLVAAALQVPLRGVSQTLPDNLTITFSGKKVPIKQVFAEIKKQTKYDVLFNPDQVDTSATITINAKNQPIESFMKAILVGLPLSYTVIKTTIVVYVKQDGVPNVAESSGFELIGMVYEEKSGNPLSGVSVVLNNAGRGTQTDGQGKFSLRNVDVNDSITFSMIGYQKVSRLVKGSAAGIFVAMQITTNDLDVAVVQAYGITSKRLSTGNITRVTAEEIAKQPVINPIMALQGKVPGMVITQYNGHASAPIKVEIRGRNSINPNLISEPLYVIDGVPLTILNVGNSLITQPPGYSPGLVQGGISNTQGQSPLFNLNPADIESIEVLKDGDATAIYGSRAANGVILISTKKAKAGKTAFNIDINQAVTDVPKRWNFLDTKQYLKMRRDAFENDGITPTVTNAPDLLVWDTTRNTNWQKELLGTGTQTNINVGLSGGDSRTTFGIRAGFLRQTEVLTRSGFNKRGTLSFNINHYSVDRKFSVSLSGMYASSMVDAIAENGNNITLAPNAPPIFDSKGNLNYADWNAIGIGSSFPFQSILIPSISKSNVLNSSLVVSYELLNGLELSVNAGLNNAQNSTDFFTPIIAQNPLNNPSGFASFGNTKNNSWKVDPQLKYSRYIGKGRLTVQLGGSLQTVDVLNTTTLAFGFTNDDLIKSVSNAAFQQTGEGNGQFKYAAAFGRINYIWDNKYIFNFDGRRDGSSRFGEGRQFGNFGSVGLAWILSEEKWLRKLLPSWISFVKLRGSYATTGSDNVGEYQYLSQWSSLEPGSGFTQMLSYYGIRPFIPMHAVNQDYHWESVKKAEGSLRVGFWNDRINFEVSAYRNVAGDQLTQFPTPIFSGFPTVTANWSAKVENTGLEVMLDARLISKKDFNWSVTFNVGLNRNKLLEYPGIEISPYATRYKVGQSLNTQYFLHYLGVDPQTGTYSFQDYNGDGIIRENSSVQPGTADDDRYVAIDVTPKYQGGFGTMVYYKGISVTLGFNFIRQPYGISQFARNAVGPMGNVSEEALNNRWKKPGDNAKYARLAALPYSGLSLNGSDGMFTDASFLRLNNLAVSYSIPERLVKKAGMRGCTVFINTQNVFTITSYDGMDPQIQYLGMPPARVINGGISFNF